ncbi:hypothetical protein [Hymenobacter sp. GOD-10R]|uniref:hypothetical protein n=1 Tax=Hymenobacter sp. GOD-10R TaxID=3093922 RepID=UPI002D76D87C|nr:hypothetical protein [Hymenobacter sp. GOD-10R]WRQ27491.1 hypothetical protein SD425_20690 [Hymenobacter sp. GOD-10R]
MYQVLPASLLLTGIWLVAAACAGSSGSTEKFSEATSEVPLDFWQLTPATEVQQLGPPRFNAQRYGVMTLALDNLSEALAAIPNDGSPGPLVAFFLPDGTRRVFRLRTTMVMAPELAARYPELRTYAGEMPAHPENRARLELTPAGLRAWLLYEGQNLLVEPYRTGDTIHYICFDKASLPADSKRNSKEARLGGN